MSAHPAYPSKGHTGNTTTLSKWGSIDRLIAGIPQQALASVQAAAAFPGIVLDDAVKHAAKNWKGGRAGAHFLVAGYHEPDVAEEHFSVEGLRNYYGVDTIIDGVLHTQVNALHTGQQAEWVASKAKSLGLRSFGLYVPNFQLPRVFMTCVECMRRQGTWHVMIPVPTPRSPFKQDVLDVSERNVTKRDLCELQVIHAEFDPRMENYQKEKKDGSPGDVATTEVLIEYLAWLYEQPEVQSHLI